MWSISELCQAISCKKVKLSFSIPESALNSLQINAKNYFQFYDDFPLHRF